GQVSWVDNSFGPLPLHEAYSYGGYCMQLDSSQLILGASFYPNREDQEVQLDDHVHNFELIHSVFPTYAKQLPPVDQWQG
ncbi:FAD-dependent cmnm(5)s(2)U34 oxidoreductase, partial [Acinetobacter baumannii]